MLRLLCAPSAVPPVLKLPYAPPAAAAPAPPAAVPPVPPAAVHRLLYAPAAAVPEEPPDLSAWRRGRTRRKNRNDTGSGALKRIRRETSADG